MPCHTRMKIILQPGLLLLYLLALGVMATSIEPGFLDFDNLPDTNFTCVGKVIGGYYADLETSCQMFHVCTIGQLDEPMDIRFLCLNGTVFDQETRVCERIDEVDCSKSEQFYSLNLELYGNTQPPIVEDSAETEPPDYYKHSSTTTSSTTAIPHSTKAKTTRQSFIITTTTKASTTTTETPIVKTQNLAGSNSADIRFNPEEINISLNPGALPNIRTKQPISYQQTFSDNNKRLTVTTHTNIYKSEPIIHITSPSPKQDVTQKYEDSHDTESQENYYHHSYNNEYPSELSKNHHYQYRNNVPNFRPSSRDVDSYLPKEYKPSTFRSIYHPTTNPPLKPNYNNRGPTTYRNHGYNQQLNKPSQQYYLRTEKPPRIQIPLPLLPTISPITFSSPAPFSLSKHTDVKRYSDHHHPRIVISASASVSDASGRKFNYSLGTIGDSRFFEPAPTSYDDYKEADVSLDPFYHDVPKLRRYKRNVTRPKTRSKKRSANRRILSELSPRRKRDTEQIFKDEKEAIDILRFLFEWYKINGNEMKHNGREMSSETVSEINKQIKYLQELDNSEKINFKENDDTKPVNLEEGPKFQQKENIDDRGFKTEEQFNKSDDHKKINSGDKNTENVKFENIEESTTDLNNNETFLIILKPNNPQELELTKELELRNSYNVSGEVLGFNQEIPDDLINHNLSNKYDVQNLSEHSENPEFFDSYDYVDDNYEPQTYVDNHNISTTTEMQQETIEVATENYEKLLKILGVTTNKPSTIKTKASPNYFYEDSAMTTNDRFDYYDYPNYDQPNFQNHNFDLQETSTQKYESTDETIGSEINFPTTTESLTTKFDSPSIVNDPTTKASIYKEQSGNNVFRSKIIDSEFSKIKSKSTDDINSDYTIKPTKPSRIRNRGSKKFSLNYNAEYQITTAFPRKSTTQNLVTTVNDLNDEASDFEPTNFDFITESFEKDVPTTTSNIEYTIPNSPKFYDSTTIINVANDFITTTVDAVESSTRSIGVKSYTNEFDSTIIVPTTVPAIFESSVTTEVLSTNNLISTAQTLEVSTGTTSIIGDPESTLSTNQSDKSTTSFFEDNKSRKYEVEVSTDGLSLATTEKEETTTDYPEEKTYNTDQAPIDSTTEVINNFTNLDYTTTKEYSEELSSTTSTVVTPIPSLAPEKLTTNQNEINTPSADNIITITETGPPTPTEVPTSIDNFITTMKNKILKNSENKRKGPKYYENFSKEVVEAIKTKMSKFDKTNKTKNLSKNKIEFNINAYTANLAYNSRFYENADPPITDPPLSKSANPTVGKKPKDFLATTPLTKSITVNINRQQFNKTYRFNCFDKIINRFYSDPRDCRLFHYCTRGYTKTQLLDMKFVCDAGTFFDDVRLICTKNKPSRCL